ncbi:hypothetical protein ABTY53_15405 [Streptomyces noursei]|uniref:hypothetical protein n=1 Tax=Streptomyces noursei TaxID=1971 RepID=UPI0033323852
MRKTLNCGLQVNAAGRCVGSFCPEPATLVVTFISRHSTAQQDPLGYCAGCVDLRFVDDEAYDKRHRNGVGIGLPNIARRSWYEIREPTETEAAELAYERAAEERWKAEGRIGEYRRIAELHSAAKVDGVLVDPWTASGCVALHDALSEKNRARWLAMPTAQQCHLAIKLTMGGKR